MMQEATVAHLRALRSSLEAEIAALEAKRRAIQRRIARGVATHPELQRDELLARAITARAWDLHLVKRELGDLA